MSPMGEVGVLLVQAITGIYVFIIMLRFLLQSVRADFYNPISQFTVKATQPLLAPLRQIIPGFGGFDLASLILALIIQTIGLVLLFSIAQGTLPNFVFLIALAGVKLLDLIINVVYFWGIFIIVIASWIAPGSYNPALNLIHQIVEPFMGRIRKVMPDMGGLDLSPIVALLSLQVLNILVVKTLTAAVMQLQ